MPNRPFRYSSDAVESLNLKDFSFQIKLANGDLVFGETIYSKVKADYIGSFPTEEEAVSAGAKYAEQLNQFYMEMVSDANRVHEFACKHCKRTNLETPMICADAQQHAWERTGRSFYMVP